MVSLLKNHQLENFRLAIVDLSSICFDFGLFSKNFLAPSVTFKFSRTKVITHALYVAGTVLIRFPTVLIFSKISLKGDKIARFLNIFPRLLAVGKSASKDEDASLMHSEPLWPNYGPLKIIS